MILLFQKLNNRWRRMKHQRLHILAIISALLHSNAGYGGETLRPLWEAGAGVAVLSIPDYRGASEQRSYVLPIPYVVYRGEVLQIDREKVRGLMFKTEHWELDMSLNGSVPVRSKDNSARTGMPNLDPTLELGPQLNYLFLDNDHYRLQLHAPVRSVEAVDHGHFHNVGWLVNPMLNLDIKDIGPDRGWNLGVSGGPLWADARYHNYFYGVNPAYATTDRPAYMGHGGYSGMRFVISMSKRYPKLWVGGFMQANDLHGTAFEDSPLLKRKSAYMAGFAVSWIFGQSDKLVLSNE
jgi:outer membrane protein